MSIAKEPFKTELFHYVGSIMDNLQFVSFGFKLYNKLLSTFPELIQYIKKDKSQGLYSKKKENGNNSNNNNMKQKHNTMIPQLPPQNPINSFRNYGNVYYQANPIYNPYLQISNMQNANYMQMQYLQQALNQGMYMQNIPMPNNIMSPNGNLNQGGYVNHNNLFKDNYYQ